MENLEFEFQHLGIYCASEIEQLVVKRAFSDLFLLPGETRGGNVFMPGMEILSAQGRGEKGHIGILTNDMDRAMEHLRGLGVEFDEASVQMEDGKVRFIYLRDEIAGFGVHLSRKQAV